MKERGSLESPREALVVVRAIERLTRAGAEVGVVCSPRALPDCLMVPLRSRAQLAEVLREVAMELWDIAEVVEEEP
jgi:hypothetical protein